MHMPDSEAALNGNVHCQVGLKRAYIEVVGANLDRC
jgi:hypothetical protein